MVSIHVNWSIPKSYQFKRLRKRLTLIIIGLFQFFLFPMEFLVTYCTWMPFLDKLTPIHGTHTYCPSKSDPIKLWKWNVHIIMAFYFIDSKKPLILLIIISYKESNYCSSYNPDEMKTFCQIEAPGLLM